LEQNFLSKFLLKLKKSFLCHCIFCWDLDFLEAGCYVWCSDLRILLLN